MASLIFSSLVPVANAHHGFAAHRLGRDLDVARFLADTKTSAAASGIGSYERVLLALTEEDNGRALEIMRSLATDSQVGNWSLVYLAVNFYNYPILEQPEFVEVRSWLGFRG